MGFVCITLSYNCFNSLHTEIFIAYFCLYSFADTLNRKNVILVLGRRQRMPQDQIKTQGKNIAMHID